MNKTIEQAIVFSREITEFPLGRCGPSDDPDKQYAYASGFRDIAVRFISILKRLNDPKVEEMLDNNDGNIDTNIITEAHILRSKLLAIIDYLNEIKDDENYLKRIQSNSNFVEDEVINRLRSLQNTNFDLQKLIRFIEELNYTYRSGYYLSSILILRAIMNHIPPIFGMETFSQVVSQSNKSIKSILSKLEGARPIADLHTHMTIRKKEYLPTKNQIEPYKSSFEILINETIVKLEGGLITAST